MAGRANMIKKKWVGVAVALSLLLLLRISSREEQEVVVACRKDHLEKSASVQSKECSPDNLSEHEEQMRVALTFDDDVIIGLSQEISYKEAVSMI